MRWMWTLAYGQHRDRSPTHGYEAMRLAAGNAECRQRQRHDRARDQAPAASDGEADREREDIIDLLC